MKLSVENIEPDLLPKLPQVKFMLLKPEDIRNYAGESLSYLKFDKFEVKDANVIVTISAIGLQRGRVDTKNVEVFEYRKVSGEWIGRLTGGYIEN